MTLRWSGGRIFVRSIMCEFKWLYFSDIPDYVNFIQVPNTISIIPFFWLYLCWFDSEFSEKAALLSRTDSGLFKSANRGLQIWKETSRWNFRGILGSLCEETKGNCWRRASKANEYLEWVFVLSFLIPSLFFKMSENNICIFHVLNIMFM